MSYSTYQELQTNRRQTEYFSQLLNQTFLSVKLHVWNLQGDFLL